MKYVGISFEQTGYSITTRNHKYFSKSIILATGTTRKKPKIDGIDKFEGKGVSYCATCDAFFYRGKDVGVIGSGDYAIHELNQLSQVVNSVTLFTNGENLNAQTRSDNLNVINQKIDKISGNEKVEEVILQDGTKKALEGIFIAIGTASTEDLAKKIGIILKNKYILVDQKMHTNIEGVFACGDCTGGLLQISKAIYEATIAALEVIEYIKRRE